MSLNIVPELVEAASHDTANIGDALSDARSAALPLITEIAPAGGDEVSAMIASLFGGHGTMFGSLAAQAQVFHSGFTANLKAAASAYQSTEQAIGQTLRDDITGLEQKVTGYSPVTAIPVQVPVNSAVGLVMGGTSQAELPVWALPVVTQLFGLPADSQLLYTPEQFWPATPTLGGLSLNQSVNQGASLLDSAIHTQWAAGNNVTVFGASQSALVETLEMEHLATQGNPNVANLHFVLGGDPNNPNGGLLARLPSFHIPFWDVTTGNPTPPNTPYQTAIYTNQYDPVSDFPAHPLNLLSDLNTALGTSQHNYTLTENYVQQPTSPGYTGATSYYMAPDNTLPLVSPLRSIPMVGNPIADLLQPDLRVLVDMGYSSNYANVPTEFSLLDIPNVPVIAQDLGTGLGQGINAAGVDLGLLPSSMFPAAYPYLGSVTNDLTHDL